MDKAVLVTIDVARGAEILAALDRAGLKISVALWANLEEYGDWRLVLASSRLDQDPVRRAYGAVHEAIQAAGTEVEHTPPLLVLRMADPFIRDLRRVFKKTASVNGMRLGGQLIGNRFVQDAYVYRIK